MNWIKRHKGKIIAAACILAVLTLAFFHDGKSQHTGTDTPANDRTEISSQIKAETVTEEATPSAALETAEKNVQKETAGYSEENKMGIDGEAGKNEDNTALDSVETPVPAEPENTEATNNALTCTLSIRCDNAVGKLSEKAMVIPEDGIIFPEQTVEFYGGESVFDVLVREMKKNKIHLEFVNPPVYNSAYIEGINNLYEFDCGELSGWMYKVNGRSPNYGCSQYELKQGDIVEWVYTCDLGKDVGGEYSGKNGM